MQFSAIQWPQFELSHFAALSFIVVCGTFLAYYFNVIGLRYLGAGITGSYIYTQPVFTAIVASLVLHEQFTVVKLIAGALIFTGVFLVSRKTPPVVAE
jgi:drug/metabolite transporter (DMT)-like permease